MGFRDAVELGVAAFVSLPDAGQQEVYDRLVSVGVEDWLALRLVYWLPSAFARERYSEVDFSDTYSEPGATRLLSDDPVFVAAAERAREATEAEMECIAGHSSEASVIQRHLAEGGNVARGEAATALVSALPPRVRGDGGVPEPRLVFAGMLQSHGHEMREQADGTYRCGELVIDAYVYPTVAERSIRARVDFEVSHPRLAKGVLYECFLGSGDTYREAMTDAIYKFERGSLHVIIAALVDPSSCPDQVDWEEWPHPEGPMHVCLGGQLLLYDGSPVPIAPLLRDLLEALEDEPLGSGVHALRIFTMRAGERVFGDEVLLDGEPWDAGLALCAAHDWPNREPAWATRLFVMFTTEKPQLERKRRIPAWPRLTPEHLARLPLFVGLNMILPLGLIAFAALNGIEAPLAARVAYVFATVVALALLAAARPLAAAATAALSLALTLAAELVGVGPIGLPAKALIIAICAANIAAYAAKHVMRPAESQGER